jgi:hypothetical protein
MIYPEEMGKTKNPGYDEERRRMMKGAHVY